MGERSASLAVPRLEKIVGKLIIRSSSNWVSASSGKQSFNDLIT